MVTYDDDYLTCDLPIRDSGSAARAESAEPAESGLDRRLERGDPRRHVIDAWRAALDRGDDVEVDRLVRQSRIDRRRSTASNPLAALLGHADQIPVDDNLLPQSTDVPVADRTARP